MNRAKEKKTGLLTNEGKMVFAILGTWILYTICVVMVTATVLN